MNETKRSDNQIFPSAVALGGAKVMMVHGLSPRALFIEVDQTAKNQSGLRITNALDKRVYLFIGIFGTLIVGAPLAFGISQASIETLRDAAVTLFWTMSAIIFFLFIVLLCRDFIFKKVTGSSKVQMNDVAMHSLSAVSTALSGDTEQSSKHVAQLVSSGLKWYTWTNFYRWVITTSVAILVAFAGFMGTVLLLEQNKRLKEQTDQLVGQNNRLDQQTAQLIEQNKQIAKQYEQTEVQNNLTSVSLVASLRKELLTAANRTHDLPNVTLVTINPKCNINLIGSQNLSPRPNGSIVDAIANAASKSKSGKKIIEALQSLVKDENGSVVLGSLEILSKLSIEPKEQNIYVNNSYVSGLSLKFSDNINLYFRDSYLSKFKCEKCSIIYFNALSSVTSGYSQLNSIGSIHVGLKPDELSQNTILSQSIILNIDRNKDADYMGDNEVEEEPNYQPIVPFDLSREVYVSLPKKISYYTSKDDFGQTRVFEMGQLTPVNSCKDIRDFCEKKSRSHLWQCGTKPN